MSHEAGLVSMMETFKITYEFVFPDARSRQFLLELDSKTLALTPIHSEIRESKWSRLENCQCTVCPLKTENVPRCPVAANMFGLSEHFKNEASTTKVTVHVHTENRTYSKTASVQEGLFSIFGVIMSTSGCPILNFLKPMARFHLPFATHEETIVRSISFHLLRQYFLSKKGLTPDLDLKHLNEQYSSVQRVNEGLLARIRSIIEKGDAESNAVVILDAFAQLLSMEIGSGLAGLEYLFADSQNQNTP